MLKCRVHGPATLATEPYIYIAWQCQLWQQYYGLALVGEDGRKEVGKVRYSVGSNRDQSLVLSWSQNTDIS